MTDKGDEADEIDGWRRRIDAVDEQLVRLLNSRSACAVEIGRLKRRLGLPVYSPEREAWILERVMRELACIAFVDPRRIFDVDGTVKAVSRLEQDVAAAYTVFAGLLLVYISIMAVRLSRMQEQIRELADRAEHGAGGDEPAPIDQAPRTIGERIAP